MHKDCPITSAMNRYDLDKGAVLQMVRMNWRLSVLSIISAAGENGVRYHNIAGMSGLNPRTLSIILKELGAKGLIEKIDGENGNSGAYRETEAGNMIIMSDCPLVRIALTERSKTRRLAAVPALLLSITLLFQFLQFLPWQ